MLVSGMSKDLKEVYSALRCSKIDVIRTESIADAKAGLTTHSPAFILLDFDIKGAKFLLNEIATGYWFPRPYVMVATSCISGSNRAEMLRMGADICVDWPINVEEVLAVIHAVRRRDRSLPDIEYKELSINTTSRAVTMRKELVTLTRKEYEVLLILASHIGAVLTKEEIHRAVWKTGYNPKSTNVSDQISSLRLKLGLDSKDTIYIQTVVGIGYRFGNIEL